MVDHPSPSWLVQTPNRWPLYLSDKGVTFPPPNWSDPSRNIRDTTAENIYELPAGISNPVDDNTSSLSNSGGRKVSFRVSNAFPQSKRGKQSLTLISDNAMTSPVIMWLGDAFSQVEGVGQASAKIFALRSLNHFSICSAFSETTYEKVCLGRQVSHGAGCSVS